MKFIYILLVMVAVAACTNSNPSSETQAATETKTTAMKNLITIVEVPTSDFPRAMKFYESVLDTKLEVVDMEGIKMAMFPTSGDGVAVQLINGADYRPSSDGTVVYLNGGDDLQTIADKIEANGGSLVVPKTAIGPEMGFYAIFIDTEGNKLGLHSPN